MTEKTVTILKDRVEQDFLPYVRQPGRYIGGEINQIKKNLSQLDLTVALCFPDIYEIAMSHTGFAIIYDVLNNLDSVAAERCFAPWLEAEKILRDKNIPLFSLESKAAIKDFDIVGFSLTNPLCYTNVLNMLDLAEIPIRSNQRTDSDPIIIAGGSMSNCAEPLAEFIDIFLLGEAEEAVVELIQLIKNRKKTLSSKSDIFLEIAEKFNFAYVPSLYKFEYEGQKIKSIKPTAPDLPTEFKNAIILDLDKSPVPLKPIVPFVQAVHERISVEIMRGCPGRCRFCQASFCRRPLRFRDSDRILEIAKAQYHATGFDTVSLLSLSSADYPELEKVVEKLKNYFEEKFVGISLPSLRVDQQLKLLPKLVTSVRKSGLTIAIEAATEKLRNIINKPITDEDLLAGINAAYQAGFQRIKLYFMVGLPGETEDDIKQIVNLSQKIALARRNFDGKIANINAAVSWLVPKPHTPFGWLGQKPKAYFENAKKIILQRKRQLNIRSVQFKFHDINRSVLESAIGKADRRIADIIETAWKSGATFDLWDECFNYDIWAEAFEKSGKNIETLAERNFANNEFLPWQHLGGPGKDYLQDHFDQAINLAGKNP